MHWAILVVVIGVIHSVLILPVMLAALPNILTGVR
jgi:hypothetical protein